MAAEPANAKRQKHQTTPFRTTASGAPLALQQLYNTTNTHIRQLSFAGSNTFNSNILLWKDVSTLPATPFAVGVWYQQSQELFPIGVVKSAPSKIMSVKDFEETQKSTHVTLSDITKWIINRIATFDIPTMRINNAREARIARAAMWSICHPDNRIVLSELERRKEEEYCLGEKPVTNYPDTVIVPDELKMFAKWFNSWLDSHESHVETGGAANKGKAVILNKQ